MFIGYTGGAAEPQWFEGYIDDIRVYNRALTEEEVSELYNLESQAPDGGVTSISLTHTVTQPAIDPEADTDGDGVLDIHETGTGTFVDANDTGSDPRAADSDGDGVEDGNGCGARARASARAGDGADTSGF